MASHAGSSEILWFDPPWRGIIPLDNYHLPRRLLRTYRQQKYQLSFNVDFAGVIAGCAAITAKRCNTWINDDIRKVYTELHHQGYAHSLEVWQETKLVGGLYGLALGGAFFGESMFSVVRDASKLALVHLLLHLNHQHFSVCDTQFLNEHLLQFGAIEISKADYQAKLAAALTQNVCFTQSPAAGVNLCQVLCLEAYQRRAQSAR